MRRTIEDAQVGSFVLFSGEIVLADLSILQQAWGNPTIRNVLTASANLQQVPQGNRQQRRKAAKDSNASEIEAVFAMMSLLPHTIQARMLNFSSGTSVWFTMDEKHIVGRPTDVLLKHGSHIQGLWHVVGILDAMPSPINPVAEDGTPLVDMLASIFESHIGQMAVKLGPVTRENLGRPETAFGLTPLLIFREVSG